MRKTYKSHSENAQFLLEPCSPFFGLFSGYLYNPRILHSNGDVTIIGKEHHIFTYPRHSWRLNNEGSLRHLTEYITMMANEWSFKIEVFVLGCDIG